MSWAMLTSNLFFKVQWGWRYKLSFHWEVNKFVNHLEEISKDKGLHMPTTRQFYFPCLPDITKITPPITYNNSDHKYITRDTRFFAD